MKTKLLKLFIFILSLSISLFAISCATPDNDGDLTASDWLKYELSEDGTFYTIVGVTKVEEKLVVPETYEGLPVKAIREGSFSPYGITSVYLPDSITEIGEMAFAGCPITKMTVEEGNPAYKAVDDSLYTKDGTVLVQYAIGKTNKEFSIPDGVVTISVGAFAYCWTLESVTIPSSVKDICVNAFGGCQYLRSVSSLENVTNIEGHAFSSCINLSEVALGDGTLSVNPLAFYDCKKLINIGVSENNPLYKTVDGNLYSKDGKTLIIYAPGNVDEENPVVEISNVEIIGESSFSGCQTLQGVTFGDGVKVIEKYAFAGCLMLISVRTGDSVEKICDYAFANSHIMFVEIGENVKFIGKNIVAGQAYGHDSLASVTFKDFSTWYVSEDEQCVNGKYVDVANKFNNGDLLKDKYCEYYWYKDGSAEENPPISEGLKYQLNEDESSYSVVGIGDFEGGYLVIPETYENLPVTEIAPNAFKGNATITSAIIGGNVKTIGQEAFRECSKLVRVEICGAVETVGYGAFYDSYYLTTVTIGDNIKTIEDVAFINCQYLSEIVIGKGVTNIGARVFTYCSITTIEVSEENQSYKVEDGVLYSKDGSCLILYLKGNDRTEFTVPSTVKTICEDAFSESDLTTIIVSDSVETIGDNAFERCMNLTTVVIGENVTEMGQNLLFSCDKLESVTFEDTDIWYLDGEQVDVTDPKENANRFKVVYCGFWNKE